MYMELWKFFSLPHACLDSAKPEDTFAGQLSGAGYCSQCLTLLSIDLCERLMASIIHCMRGWCQREIVLVSSGDALLLSSIPSSFYRAVWILANTTLSQPGIRPALSFTAGVEVP